MKVCGLVLFMICLTTSTVLAQTNPTVEITLSRATAHLGEVVTANVYVRNATNVGGLDIGIRVDEQCLRIIDRQPGGYLPTTGAEGAFSAFSELNEHDTRLAAALTDRTKYASGDGIFYSVPLEVTCAEGTASLDFTYALVSVYVDPTAEIIDVISYDLDKSTLNHINAQLTIVPGSAVAPLAVNTLESPATVQVQTTIEGQATVEGQATIESQATVVATTDASVATPVPAQTTEAAQNSTSTVVLIGLLVLGIFFLGLVFWLIRRTARGDETNE